MPCSFLVVNYLLLCGIAVIWGCQFVFTDIAVATLPPLTLAAGRIFFGALTLWVLSLFFKTEKLGSSPSFHSLYKTYLVISFFEAILPFFLVAYGQKYVDSGIAAILLGTIPLFTLIFSHFYLAHSQWRFLTILSVTLGFIGILLLLNPFQYSLSLADLRGHLALLGAAISFSISLILLKNLPSTLSPLIAVRNILSAAAVPMILFSLIFDSPWALTWNLANLSCLFVLGFFCAGIVYFMYMILIRRTNPTFASLTNYLIPPIGVLLGVFLLNESLHFHQLVALGIILVALMLNQYMPLQREDADL